MVCLVTGRRTDSDSPGSHSSAHCLSRHRKRLRERSRQGAVWRLPSATRAGENLEPVSYTDSRGRLIFAARRCERCDVCYGPMDALTSHG
jgi:hypothetical protein